MTTEALPTTSSGSTASRRRAALGLAREQSFVAAGQVLSGAGNLAFVLVMARALEPRAFSQLAAFLAMYLLIHVPASSLSAGSALAPRIDARSRRRTLATGALVGLALLAAAVPLAPLLHLPVGLVVVLAAVPPAAGLLALERGRLYGSGALGRSVASLVVEPAIRLTAGVALALAFGPVGGAVGVILAGYAALVVAAGRGRRMRAPTARRSVVPGASGEPPQPQTEAVAARSGTAWVVIAFLLLALLQNQDVLFANALLPSTEAGRFAVLSTLGGIAAFASTTVPLVLLPRAARGERHALSVAVLVAAALGLGAVAAVLVAPAHTIGAIFGERYASLRSLAPLYLLAMALLGVARVLVAARCAEGRSRAMVLVLALAAAAHVGLILGLATSASGVAGATLGATALLALVLTAGTVVPLRRRRRRRPATGPRIPGPAAAGGPRPAAERPRAAERLRPALPVLVLMAIGLALRLDVTRGIWVDEATSISQARMPFHQMIENIRTTDVHPPLHHALLWLTVRLLGSGQLAVRIPSIVAGTLLIGALYLVGRELYDRRAGLLAAALGAVAPFMVWYSQEARMYAFFMLFATLAVWAQVGALRHGKPRDWLLYALATAAMLWTQYFTILPILVQQAGFLAVAWQRRRERPALMSLLAGWAAALAFVALAFLPLWPILHDQLQAYKTRGSSSLTGVPSQAGAGVSQASSHMSVYGAIANFIWAVWGYHSDRTMAQIAALWPAAMLLALLMLGRGRSRVSLLLVGVAVVPAAVLFAVGFHKRDLFEIRYFSAAVPALLLLFARVATSWTAGRVGRAAIALVLMGSMALGLVDQQLNGTNPRRYDFQGALSRVEHEMRPGDRVVYEPGFLQPVIRYYEPRLRISSLDAGLPKRSRAAHGRVFLLASFLDKPQYASGAGAAIAKLERGQHRRLVERFSKPQIKVWVFK
jgi:O-antigen/teichoic acid export membrane protein